MDQTLDFKIMKEKSPEKFVYNKTPIGAGNGIVDGIGTLGPNYGIPQTDGKKEISKQSHG